MLNLVAARQAEAVVATSPHNDSDVSCRCILVLETADRMGQGERYGPILPAAGRFAAGVRQSRNRGLPGHAAGQRHPSSRSTILVAIPPLASVRSCRIFCDSSRRPL